MNRRAQPCQQSAVLVAKLARARAVRSTTPLCPGLLAQMTTIRLDGTARWQRVVTSPLARSARRWWRFAPLLLAIAYLIALGVQFGHVIAATYLDADNASGPVIGQLFGEAPASANVVVASHGWYWTLLFELATKWLPLHRQAWEAFPCAMALASAALTTAAVWRIAGRAAACLTGVLLICLSPYALHWLLSPVTHGQTWFCIAVLGWWLVEISLGTFDGRPRLAFVLAVAVGIFTGVAASDPLARIGGLVPFVLGLLVGCLPSIRRGNYRSTVIALVTLLVTAVAWLGISIAMSALNVLNEPGLNMISLATGDQVTHNLNLWWQSIAVLGNGDFFGMNVTVTSVLALVCAALSIAAVLLIPRICWHEMRQGPQTKPTTWATPRRALLVFWSLSAGLLSIAFIVSNAPVDITTNRWLVGVIYAVAVVIPVAASGRSLTEALAVGGTILVALSGAVAMSRGTIFNLEAGLPSDGVISRVEQIAALEDLRIGYAGYWDASPMTWASHERIRVYPVYGCIDGRQLCRFVVHTISSWYTPRPNIRTFVIVDPTLPWLQVQPTSLGRPVATYHIAQLTMYVYPYDVAARIHPNPYDP